MKNTKKGFTLIELLIVVAIILVIAAIAIPSLLSSKMSANESSAVGSLRTMMTSATNYSTTYSNGFPPSLGAMGGGGGASTASCDNALILDSLLSNNGAGNSSAKSGYNFTYTPGTAISTPGPGCTNPGVTDFTIVGVPQQIGATGQRGFFVDQTGVIRYTTDGSAPTSASPPLQ